ncbi:uncharacterized protein LOC111301955 [Durio zibethinus]|uniref:Uncharacterized protein LOC111301955 n=1 Tax=Durio zibethinus TaxID=66656 RepID=A0A6P5ZMP3_DURZI|nr:uncharacterized protein LOC111301955 [Durio zibethinus]
MASSNCSLPPPPIFSGENYQIWAVKMKTYLSAFNLWEVVENEKEPPQLLANPTVTQMKNYSEEKVKRYKAKSCIESLVSDDIFIRIMTCETTKQAWMCLRKSFKNCSMFYKLKSKEGLSDKRIQQKVLLQPRRKARCKQKAKAENKEIKETKFLETMKRKENSHLTLTAIRPFTWRNIVGTDLTYNVGTVSSLVT